MAELVADCPRCKATRTTFDVLSQTIIGHKHEWQTWYEAFCVCRHCTRSTVFVLSESGVDEQEAIAKAGGLLSIRGSLNQLVGIENFISQKDAATTNPPDHLPAAINAAFTEGAKCLAAGCNNAAATMFRLSIDLATRPLLPERDERGLDRNTRRELGRRLIWLFDQGILHSGLRQLSNCIKEDGNDGAHAGTIGPEDAEDLLDFSKSLFERLYTEPEKLRLAEERRKDRRDKARPDSKKT